VSVSVEQLGLRVHGAGELDGLWVGSASSPWWMLAHQCLRPTGVGEGGIG
jgi:hypothetical protein